VRFGDHEPFSGERHTCHPDFGKGVDPSVALEKMLSYPGRVTSTEAQLVLRDFYENDYGIYNHANPKADNPFAMVLHHWCEDTVAFGPLHDEMEKFLQLDVPKHFGLSWDEFLNRPEYECRMMFTLIAQKLEKEVGPMSDALRAMDEASKRS
jgi:hypothetical protein